MRLSVLVVSRTAALINRLCDSLDTACGLAPIDVEILCSWNGSDVEEAQIRNSSRYDFHIAQRVPYHFATNMNSLAALSGGEVLMLANDDLILDPGCVDAAIQLLSSRPKVGLVGALLRDNQGFLSHAGINFDLRCSSYHLLDRVLPVARIAEGLIPSAPVAAVTGALQWIDRDAFLRHPFNSEYLVNGEDVELCLDVQQHLGQEVWLCSDASAIHDAETTRSQDPLQAGNSADELRLRARTRNFLDQATGEQLRVLLQQQQRESQLLRDELQQECGNAKQLRLRLKEQEAVLLSLREERLRLRDQLDAKEDCR
ncbi:hypothetical protein [Synechococcus sp. MU1642]|uniref:hypothetical protein n=1 Tax=Synechococcus sp. MU1642 TaxID=2508348 RepID=UPI001CF86E30|nr:hypothetical protein [Synechococcus sp. MU1642]MCB4406958.1 glycosyltransferase family 2 protein [Synechococcus sp. MU1642]